jgi:hypothetical protein
MIFNIGMSCFVLLQPWAVKNEVLHLLQLQMITPQLSSSIKRTYCSGYDEFRSLVLKPMYVRKQLCDAKGTV